MNNKVKGTHRSAPAFKVLPQQTRLDQLTLPLTMSMSRPDQPLIFPLSRRGTYR